MTTSLRTTEPVASSHLDLPPPATPMDAVTHRDARREPAAAPSLPAAAPTAAPPEADASRARRCRTNMIGGIVFATIAVALADRLLSARGPGDLPFGLPFAALAAAAIAAAAASIMLGVTAVRLSDDSPNDDAPAGSTG